MHRIHSVFLKLVFTVSILLSTSIAVTPANASMVEFNFAGAVDYVSSGLSASSFGQTMYGLIKYEDGTSDSNGLAGIGRYNGAIMGGSVHFSGGYSETLGGSGDNNFIDIQKIGDADVYQLRAPVMGSLLDYYQISIIHYPSSFSNSLFPPTIGMMSQSQFRLVLTNPQEVTGHLTGVPLPPAVILFGAGLVALIGLGARNWQRAQDTRESSEC